MFGTIGILKINTHACGTRRRIQKIWNEIHGTEFLVSIFILGGEILRGFSFAMILGVLIGTYSSIFVASPILKYFKVSYKTIEKDDEKIVP